MPLEDLNTPTPTPQPGEGTPTPQPQVTPPPTPDPTASFVPLDRFEVVTAQKWDAIREAELAKAELAQAQAELTQLRAGQAPEPPARTTPPAAPPVAPTPSRASQADVDARAQQLLFDRRCSEVASQGKAAHQDFDSALEALKQVSPLIDAMGRPALPMSLVESAIETGLGHEVLYALGKNTSEADRLMTLPPVRQAVEVARFAEKLRNASGASPEPRLNGASLPPPIAPVVGGRALPNPSDLPLDSPELPMAEFIKRRDAEEKARRQSGRRL